MAEDVNQIAVRIVGGIGAPAIPAEQKNPAAVMLGRRGGLKGGKARAAKMTPEQRASAARHAARMRWGHKAEIEHGRVYMLEDVPIERWHSGPTDKRTFKVTIRESRHVDYLGTGRKNAYCFVCHRDNIAYGDLHGSPGGGGRVCIECVDRYRTE